VLLFGPQQRRVRQWHKLLVPLRVLQFGPQRRRRGRKWSLLLVPMRALMREPVMVRKKG